MANILIIDNQLWVKDLCKESLTGEGYNVLTTDDVESVMKNVLSFKPHIVLLNQYLIKMQNPNLPVVIVTAHDTHLVCPHLSKADGYLVKSHTAADELREKISYLLNKLSIFQKDTEIPSSIQP